MAERVVDRRDRTRPGITSRSLLGSPYLRLAGGERKRGRPSGAVDTVLFRGNPRLMVKAKRRALAVLKERHMGEYRDLVSVEYGALEIEEQRKARELTSSLEDSGAS